MSSVRLDKLHAKLVRNAYGAVAIVRQHLQAEGTGLRLLSSVHNLSSRLALFTRATGSPHEAQRILGGLLQFDGIGERLVVRHREEVVRSANNFASLFDILRDLQTRLRDVWRDSQDLIAKLGQPPLTPVEYTCTSPGTPSSISELLSTIEHCYRFVSVDITHKLQCQAVENSCVTSVSGQAAASSINDARASETSFADVKAKLDDCARVWACSAKKQREKPAVGGSGPAASDSQRAALWSTLCELCWRVTGESLVEENEEDEADDDDASNDGGPTEHVSDSTVGNPR